MTLQPYKLSLNFNKTFSAPTTGYKNMFFIFDLLSFSFCLVPLQQRIRVQALVMVAMFTMVMEWYVCGL